MFLKINTYITYNQPQGTNLKIMNELQRIANDLADQKNFEDYVYSTAELAEDRAKETPLMKQHQAIKSRYPDAVVLFRAGDFYETFREDAVIAAKVLGITLTKWANGAASHIELAGFPHHSLETYLHKLVKAGYRVAICDQLEDPE
jgi:DNA mismatch repair protein MutS